MRRHNEVSDHWCHRCQGIGECVPGNPPSRSPRCVVCGAKWPAAGNFCDDRCRAALAAEFAAAEAQAQGDLSAEAEALEVKRRISSGERDF